MSGKFDCCSEIKVIAPITRSPKLGSLLMAEANIAMRSLLFPLILSSILLSLCSRIVISFIVLFLVEFYGIIKSSIVYLFRLLVLVSDCSLALLAAVIVPV